MKTKENQEADEETGGVLSVLSAPSAGTELKLIRLMGKIVDKACGEGNPSVRGCAERC